MDFKLTEEQELLLESVEEFCKTCGFDDNYFKTCYAEARVPYEYQKAMMDAGLGLLGLPEKYGGTPVDVLTMMLVNEKTLSLGYPNMFGSILQIDDMLTFGSEKHRQMIFECLAEGKNAFCLGFSEPQAGSDSLACTTTTTERDGKIYINGHKTFITAAPESRYMLTVSRDFNPDKPIYNDFSMWLVPMDAPGVKIEPLHKLGHKSGGTTADVYLEDVELTEEDLVGVRGNGFIQLMKNFETERLLMASSSLGYAENSFNDAAAYANQRVQFGKPIGSYQMIQEKLVNMAIKIENMKNFIYKCAWEKDNGISIQTSANLCKIYCAQAGFEVCDDAMQIFGSIGYSEEHRVSRNWLDTRMHRIGGGTDEILIRAAAKQILKQYK